MTEERKCYNCAIDRICQECDMGNSNWQPIAQEKPIGKKVIFESREDCYKFCEKVKLGMNHEAILWHVNEIEKHGYIRKTALEEAEERYEQSKRDFPTPKGVRDLADEYIQELKSEIARGKK